MSRFPDFIWVLFVIFLAVSSMLNKSKQSRGGKGSTSARRPGGSEAEENARRIQEEIRRRIRERRAGGPVPEAVAADLPPLLRQDEPLPQEGEAAGAEESPPPAFANAAAEELSRQRALEEKLRALRETRRAIEREAGSISHVGMEMKERPSVRAAARMDFRAAIQADLRDPRRTRRVIALREILGPPVGLR